MLDYLFFASNFNGWAGPNNHLLDLCNYLHNEMHIDLKLISHTDLLHDDFFEWIKFPLLPVLQGKSPVQDLRYGFPNARCISEMTRSLKLSPDKIFVNSSIDTLFSTYFSVKRKVKTGYNVLCNNPNSTFYNVLDHIAAKTLISKIVAHTEYQKNLYKKIGIAEKKNPNNSSLHRYESNTKNVIEFLS